MMAYLSSFVKDETDFLGYFGSLFFLSVLGKKKCTFLRCFVVLRATVVFKAFATFFALPPFWAGPPPATQLGLAIVCVLEVPSGDTYAGSAGAIRSRIRWIK